ncbi:unnamed protein product [Parnassius mnemosyne]|uniref:Uncharacterized protein n=1 Tax=Parnassius mnemosyne TaxID=213953 RepID=A0AAV1KM73_9NEOP
MTERARYYARGKVACSCINDSCHADKDVWSRRKQSSNQTAIKRTAQNALAAANAARICQDVKQAPRFPPLQQLL